MFPFLSSSQSLLSPPAWCVKPLLVLGNHSSTVCVSLFKHAHFPQLPSFLSLTFFLSPFLFSQPSFPPFPSLILTIPPSAHSSSTSLNRSFTCCLSPASAELGGCPNSETYSLAVIHPDWKPSVFTVCTPNSVLPDITWADSDYHNMSMTRLSTALCHHLHEQC